MHLAKTDEERGIAAVLFSAVGSILLVVKISINFLKISDYFDT